jgi:uncharacterized membrane protein (DUF373 family)
LNAEFHEVLMQDPDAAASSQMVPEGARRIVARAFTLVEDIVYVALGVLLSITALILLGHTALTFSRALLQATLPTAVIVELLYTVQVSFREHAIAPEPFLVVGLVAATRRVLVLTAEFTVAGPENEASFRVAMIELGVLTAMILALVGSLLMLRGRRASVVARSA